MKKSLYKLENVIQNYIWGSQTAINELFGIDNPNNQPQAEIWMGAHPNGCSKIADGGLLLSDLIAQDPVGVLGDYTYERFGDLPFLFKVLSADKPLSVQVHPNRRKAIKGYHKENLQGLELSAGNRNYKDANHKPELVYALTFYKAMNGFRPIGDIVTLFNQAGIETLRVEVDTLADMPSAKGLQAFFSAVMTLSGERKFDALAELRQATSSKAKTSLAREAFALISEFCEEYMDDIGLFSPLMLNVVELDPGEAMFLHAETPHAYIKGTGLEIMANSDNVLRAGLTPKHMDVVELIANTRFISTNPDHIKLTPYQMENKVGYPIPVDDFGFEVIKSHGVNQSQYVRGAEILFCIDGEITVEVDVDLVSLKAGESVFICSSAKVYHYQGVGTLARAFN
ncbi:mannose-6-phosphate isomerase, class I [Vibrio scophthalmi]|uniref:mannose-6-phosphate isomerase, class I n=1 Tax=Vibrio scophthalmi TaxID=45658 RepID=UPI00228408DC|nr:mannose-6-phosphate isomerase, class I [Vibrio scophthalmi]MCY9804567.1 mannose-6-phosphate isomerase, class I [Vibrio scophthalmi]